MSVAVTIDEIDAMVDIVLSTTVGERAMLGICGPPGSGKSFFACRVSARVNARLGTGTAAVLPMDGFHLANDVLVELGRRDRKGAPDTFDVRGFAAMLDHVRFAFVAGEAAYAPRFDRDLEAAIAGAIAIPALARLVVVEGNYLLHDDGPWATVVSRLDETWYIDVSSAVREQRLLERHRIGHGDGAADWISRVDAPNAALIERTKSRADRVITPPDFGDAS